jgi:LPXTG-motif cell wall-anchored protein
VKAGKLDMKLKLLKKLMIICMSFSLSVSMVPASVLAAGKDSSEGDTQAVQVISGDTESESANTETETKSRETKHHKDKETEIKGGFVPESESQAVIESEAVITEQTPQTGGEAGQKKGAVGKKVKTAGKITPNGTPNVDYKNENGKYTILEDKAVTLTLSDGASLGEVIVKSGATLTIVLKGTTTNTIGTISGEGKVQFAKISNGKANLKGSIDVAETTVEGGTLFGSGTIKSTQVSLNGGSIACKVTNDVKSGDLTLKASEFTVEKDAVCTIDNVQLGGEDVSMDANMVWSDSNGKAVVYFQPASTVAFSIKAVTFTSSEETADSITAKEQNYTYEAGNLKKGKSATAYTVKVGADLTTTYGEKLENVDIITVSAAKDYTPEVSLRDYDEAMDSSLELKDGTAKGYKVTKKNIKEKPDEKSFSLNEVLVTDTFGYDHILSGTVNYKIEKKELTPLISVNKISTTSKNKATKVYDGTTDVPDDTCTLSGFSGIVDGDKASDVLAVAKATFIYDHADVATAKNIKAEVTLSGDPAECYTVASVDDISAEITKAPLTEKLMKSLGITLTKPEVTERHYQYLKYKTVAGQEYAYSEKAKDDEWKLAKKASTITYVNEVDGEEQDLKAGTSYKIYTRIPESDNYLASDPVSVSVKTLRAPQEAKESDVKFTGVTDNSTQKLNTALTFTATGSTYVDDKDYKPSADDEKYVPYSWKLTDTTTWKGDKSTQTFTMTPTQAGTYTIVATFRKYVYDGKKWVYSEGDDVKKSITFKANESGTSSSTSGSGSSSSSSSSGSTNTAAKTGDTTPVVPVAAALVVSGAALALTLKKRKKEEK